MPDRYSYQKTDGSECIKITRCSYGKETGNKYTDSRKTVDSQMDSIQTKKWTDNKQTKADKEYTYTR